MTGGIGRYLQRFVGSGIVDVVLIRLEERGVVVECVGVVAPRLAESSPGASDQAIVRVLIDPEAASALDIAVADVYISAGAARICLISGNLKRCAQEGSLLTTEKRVAA